LASVLQHRDEKQKRTGLEEIAIYYLDLNCYHTKGNLIVKRLWWKTIQNPSCINFVYTLSIINEIHFPGVFSIWELNKRRFR